MNCVFISDIHIRTSSDLAAQTFKDFCSHSHTLHADKVFFLGDIFDHLAGDHKEYIKQYDFFFEGIEKLIELDKEVIFLEGNHDFHFSKLFSIFFAGNSRFSKNFRYLKAGESIMLNEKRVYFCHGYEVDYYNNAFKNWYKIYSSKWFYYLITHFFTYSFLQKIAKWASGNSKQRGKKSFDYTRAKERYVEGAYELIKDKKVDGIIAGHTHIFSDHQYPSGEFYYNCGFPQRDRKFLSYKADEFHFISLGES